ncbi:hypothetical protein OZ410_07050 [Robiginitalea sp. M366]|uniref:hypothetical protein n=1 Tax=Robiginitalea aestuariiviva TaxID=3036903 RepID=UPI00240E5789|nr:hypothetical protein [Robiginitalea aestuariiviva]MDG1572067.1 hypothetical protein [Robiginitalea aestuariiviva]
MRLFPALFAFYVRGSLHVSLALVALLAFSEAVVGAPVPPAYYWAVFLAGVAGYNAIKAVAWPDSRLPGSHPWHAFIPWLSLPSAGLSLYFLIQLPLYYIVLTGVGALLALLYALPLLPGMRNLRSFGLLKVFWVALVWTLLTLWIPYWEFSPWKGGLALEGLQRLLLVCLLMLPFEVRDMAIDPPSLITLPRKLGMAGTHALGWIGVGVYLLLLWWEQEAFGAEKAGEVFMALATGLAIQCSHPQRGRYFAGFWVEAIPIGGYVVLRAWELLLG